MLELLVKYKKIFVIDTNIILNDSSNVEILSGEGDNLIVLPETVLDEVDNKKSGFDEINFQAREFGRILQNSELEEILEFGEIKVLSLKVKKEDFNLSIWIASKDNYRVLGNSAHQQNILSDKKILEMAEDLQKEIKTEITVITLDIIMRTRAISMGLKTQTLLLDKKSVENLSFTKEIEINDEQLANLDHSPIREIDPEYSTENFSYKFKHLNGRVVLAVIQNGRVKVLDENELRKQIIKPKNVEQLFFSHALFDPFYDVITVNARAGSGKTILALSSAMALVRKKEFLRIVYIRNSIESLDKGEDVGYLSGNSEKFAVYNHPLYDSLDFILREMKKKSNANKKGVHKESEESIQITEERMEEVISQYGIETMWVGELRGRTIHNAFVIVDEAQNISDKTMKTILTRVADDCKVVVIGSLRQIDNIYLNKHTSSLTRLLSKMDREFENINAFSIELNKVVRGKITEWAESEIFSE
jgi:PhoH-like ATPase